MCFFSHLDEDKKVQQEPKDEKSVKTRFIFEKLWTKRQEQGKRRERNLSTLTCFCFWIKHVSSSPLRRTRENFTILSGLFRRDRRTWLILPVVICLFQGLSHANVRVLVLRYRGVCVRLIITILIYPTKDGFLPFRRDNCAKCAANTWKKVSRLPNHFAGKLCVVGSRKLLAETKAIAVPTADTLIVDAGQRSRSVVPCGSSALLDEFSTYQADGSVVDYRTFDG